MPRRVLIAGCGYVGRRLARVLAFHGDEVWGIRRDTTRLPDGVHPVAADVTDPATLGDLPDRIDAVVYAVSPSGRTDDAYRAAYVDGLGHVLDALEATRSFRGRAVLVTSTGVYGQTDGRWVDEETDPEPADSTGQRLLEAEGVVRERGAPGAALRLGGIYGPGRTRTLRRVVEGEAGCPAEGRYGNRIHQQDAAEAIHHLLGLDDPHPVYLGVDRDPALLRDVYRWVAEHTGAPDPCAGEDTESWEARGRRGTSKRCSSDRLSRSGFRFRYPTFREGYRALLLEEGLWRGP